MVFYSYNRTKTSFQTVLTLNFAKLLPE